MDDDAYDPQEIRDTLTEREADLIRNHHLDLGQIAWRRMKARSTGVLFKQEYPEDPITCFLTTGAVFFDASRVLDLLESIPDYEVTPIGSYGYSVEWQEPVDGVSYVVGADTSEGIPGTGSNRWFAGEGASDPNGCGVIREDTGEQVAAVHGIFSPAELALHCKVMAQRYNGAVLAIERNNHGHAVIAHLENGDGPAYWPNLYHHDDGRAGWVTSPKTRPKMLSDMREAVDEGEIVVNDRHFLQECLTFRKQSDGKWRAESPDHDDVLFKYMIAWQVRQQPRVRSQIIS
jgi:hypothetical protein